MTFRRGRTLCRWWHRPMRLHTRSDACIQVDTRLTQRQTYTHMAARTAALLDKIAPST